MTTLKILPHSVNFNLQYESNIPPHCSIYITICGAKAIFWCLDAAGWPFQDRHSWATIGWVNLLLSASLSILLPHGAHRVGKKVCRDNGCNLEGLLFVSLSKLACWGGTNCRTRLQLRGPHKQSRLLLKLNSLIHDLGTAGTGEKREHIRQLLQWGWQSGLRVQDIDPVLSSIFCWVSAVDISQNFSLDLSLSRNGDDQVLWDI